MILFLDTNVLIGYIFLGDQWNSHSNIVLNCKNDKYYSTNVLKELKKKIKKIKKEIYQKILQLKAFLIKKYHYKNFITKDELENIISVLGFKRIEFYIIQLFYNNYNYEAPKEEFLKDLTDLANEFFGIYPVKLNELERKLILHNRKKDYYALENQIKLIHEEDRIIFIDAHDLCTCTIDPLIFITSDYGEQNIELILENTDINKVKNLRDFNRALN